MNQYALFETICEYDNERTEYGEAIRHYYPKLRAIIQAKDLISAFEIAKQNNIKWDEYRDLVYYKDARILYPE